ncbi:MAG: hypothetical protein JSR38_13640 [Proteobacteria bacterium]|nr:hypothetical protein [Pseudomonadota bacterium]
MTETVRPWRVITHTNNDQAQRSEAIVQVLKSYELAMHAYREALRAHQRGEVILAELRDPSGRTITDSHQAEPMDAEDGLANALPGRYGWFYFDPASQAGDGQFHRLP